MSDPQERGWWNKRKARKRAERMAANERDIENGVIQKVKAPLGLDNGAQWYTVDWRYYFVIDADGFHRTVWSETEELR